MTEMVGEDFVTDVKVRNVKTGEETLFPTQGVFVAIGYVPNTDFLGGQLELTEGGLHRGRRRPADQCRRCVGRWRRG